MADLNVNSIGDASGGNTATINGQTPTLSNMAGRNRIINGDMRIDQRNAGASVTPSTLYSTYTLDRWKTVYSVGSKFSVQQNAGSVTPPSGFNYYLGVTSLSAYTPGSAEQYTLVQNIEGYNVADFGFGAAGAQTVTLSFWVRSSLTGTFGGVLGNAAANRTYPFTYTINAANTWEQKTITVAGDTTGTWLSTNSTGMQVIFSLGAGSTYLGAAGSWSSGTYTGATGQTNLVATNGATFYITGVQLEAGSVATPFEHRQYGQELALAQRYYQQWDYSIVLGNPGSTAFTATKYNTSDSIIANASLLVSMRAAPTVSSSNTTCRYVSNTAIGGVTFINLSSPGNGTINLIASNNSISAGFGWLDGIGVLTASAEL